MPVVRPSKRLPPARRRQKLPNGVIVTAFLSGRDRSVDQLLQALRNRTLDASKLTEQEERTFWKHCRKEEARLLSAVEACVAAGSDRLARKKRYLYAKSLPARVVALRHAMPKGRKRTASMTWAEAELRRRENNAELFSYLGLVKHLDERAAATVWREPKPKGGHRLLSSFSWLDQARHRLLRDSHLPFARLHHSQYLLTRRPEGRGQAAACKALQQQLGGLVGDHVFMQIDIRDFYGSISHSWLESHLDLDIGTIRRHAHTGGMRLSRVSGARSRPTDEEIQKLRRQGIAQGSAFSSLVGELVMANILQGLTAPLGAFAITYSDNIGIIVPKGEEGALEELLRAAFASHVAGPFHIEASSSPMASTFKFLGYWWKVDDDGAHPFIRDVEAETWAIYTTAEIMHASRQRLDKLEHRIRGKCGSWSLWPGARQLERELLANLQSARETAPLHDCGTAEHDMEIDEDWTDWDFV